ncbi:MAG: peptide chain release factor N(5)-glutamine methyltransferase [Spirochaetia bacterium]|nr:peptide chain release factor N(5)-glutamine methyltransferase [Spirochaetia bacterium]
MNLTIKEAFTVFENYLKDYKIENARLETRILFCRALNLLPTQIFTKEKEVISSRDYRTLKSLFKKKIKGYPTAYITGEKEFFSRNFLVNKNVLIPRPETEELIEWIIYNTSKEKKEKLDLIDIGCGSGCIGITLFLELNINCLTFIDISRKALKVCQKNVEKLILNDAANIEYIKNNFLNMKDFRPFDMAVSNPPYVLIDEFKQLDKSVKDFEPKKGLLVKNPEVFFKTFFQNVFSLLKGGGTFYLETNPLLIELKRNLLSEAGFSDIEIKKDLSEKNRFIKCVKK